MLHQRLHHLYNDDACCYTLQLAADKNKYAAVVKAFNTAAEYIHNKKGFTSNDLNSAPIKALTTETYNVLKDAVNTGITHEVPAAMRQALLTNTYIFSGLKTNAQLLEAHTKLLDESGNIKPLAKFKEDIAKLDAAYNENYLEAEYQFATHSAQMAAKWQQLAMDGDRYDLQYRTANDDRVRQSHRVLQNITLPPTDAFWNSYYPPNGWRCRCTVVQVLKGKYPTSNSSDALAAGEKATTELDKNGNNKAAIFRFNPGKQQTIFGDEYPYRKIAADKVKTIVEQQAVSEVNPKFLPKKILDYEKKLNISVNYEIFSYLTSETPLTIAVDAGGGSHYNLATKQVHLRITERYRTSKWYSEAVVYHEYGHALDQQHGISKMQEITDLMNKYRKTLAKNKNAGYKEKEIAWMTGDKSTPDHREQTDGYADTLMSLNPSFGQGHTKTYYKLEGFKEAEFVAHLFENRFKGNAIFEQIHPELYKEGIATLNTILENIKPAP